MRRITTCLLGTLIVGGAALAETTFTFVSGLVITGSLTEITADGLKIQPAGKAEAFDYPWASLAPGTRFRYDQQYRMNVKGYLEGEERSKLTNAPDSRYDPMQPGATIPEANDVVPARPAGDAQLDLNLFAPTAAVGPSSLRALTGAAGPKALYWGFQYGSGARDVVVFGFPEGEPSRLVNARLSSAGRVSTENATADGDRHLFPARTFSSSLGPNAMKTQVEWIRSGANIDLRAVVTLTQNNVDASWTLTGRLPRPVQEQDNLLPLPLLAEPAFDFTLGYEDKQPVLLGRLRMGPFTLTPGTDTTRATVNVEIKDATGVAVLSERNLRLQGDRTPTLKINLSPVKQSGTFTIIANTDLGPLFGPITHQTSLTLP